VEPTDGIALLAVAHVASALFMVAPLYMLVVVNERARLGAPLGLPHDAYLENIIRGQPIRCYAYLGVLILTGVALVVLRGESFTSPTLLVKIAATVAILGILSYVHFSLQPRVDRELATLAPGAPAPESAARTVPKLRLQRKRLSATCLFLVLTAAIFGVRLLVGFSFVAAAVVVLASAALSWRAYRSGVRYGYV
jgi:hypothetical protein